MPKNIAGRKVRLFRCQIPPLITSKILNAHIPKDHGWEAEVDSTSTGIWVKTQEGKEHFVPFTNIQHAEFYPEETEEAKKPIKARSQAV